MNKVASFFFEVLKTVILALVIVIPIRYFVFQPFIVKGISMEPAFQGGNYLIVDELSYRFRDPARGEVIVFRYPKNPSERFIKRVVGLPLETIILQRGKIEIIDEFKNKKILDESKYIFSQNWPGDVNVILGEDEYFVLGDNRIHSLDSRKWGVLNSEYIIGRAILRAWPPNALSPILAPDY